MQNDILALQREIQKLTTPTASHSNQDSTTQPGSELAKQAEKHEAYQKLILRFREAVRKNVPENATVLVVSRGDDQLLLLGGPVGWHFPQTETGIYAGHNPPDSQAAIAHLESLRARGAQYIVFPATGFWWLDHYLEFRQHLETRYRLILRQEDACAIYQLSSVKAGASPSTRADTSQYSSMVRQLRGLVDAILPEKSVLAVISKGDPELMQLGARTALHLPSTPAGEYAGYHPADSAQAIEMLESLRSAGAQYLVVPQPSLWWLTHYTEFAAYLESKYLAVVRQQHVCWIYDLKA